MVFDKNPRNDESDFRRVVRCKTLQKTLQKFTNSIRERTFGDFKGNGFSRSFNAFNRFNVRKGAFSDASLLKTTVVLFTRRLPRSLTYRFAKHARSLIAIGSWIRRIVPRTFGARGVTAFKPRNCPVNPGTWCLQNRRPRALRA